MDREPAGPVGSPMAPYRFDRREISGSLGDLGVLLPIAVLLITINHLDPSAVFGGVGLTYLLSGLYYRVPMAVQPLKSFSSIAIALGLGASVISAGAVLMGVALLALGLTGAADWIARVIPKTLIRGIQFGVGLILVRVGYGFCVGPMAELPGWVSVLLAVGTAGLIYAFLENERYPAGLIAIGGGLGVGLLISGPPSIQWGLMAPEVRLPSLEDFHRAALYLVLPQIPLTLTNSVAATRDVARQYFGEGARRVSGRALTLGLGVANVGAGVLGGMPVCHGSGGVTAHHRFGSRTGGTGIFLGAVLLMVGVGFAPSIEGFCRTIPRPVLGALMVYVGIAHCMLVRDVRGAWSWGVVLATGLIGGLLNHNGYGMLAGGVVLGIERLSRALRCPRMEETGGAS